MDPFELPVDDDLAAVLAKTLKLEGFFPEFKAEHVALVFPRSRLLFFPRGSTILAQGDCSRDFYVIRLGRVGFHKMLGDAGADLGMFGPGDMFGEIALLRGGPRTASAVAQEDCQVFRLAHEDVQYLLANNQQLAGHLRSLAEERLAR